jgi:prepilin-type N-terminal cleavage/methylation domain-containing protein
MSAMNRQRGFTLKEIMIVVLIVSILSAIAVRSFRKAALKDNRQNGISCLVEVQKRIEDFYTRNAGTSNSSNVGGYPPTGDLSGIGYASPANCPVAEGKSVLYTLSYILPDTGVSGCALCYKLTATGAGAQARDGTLVLRVDPRSTAAATDAYHKQHVTPSGTTVDGWIFNPGQ